MNNIHKDIQIQCKQPTQLIRTQSFHYQSSQKTLQSNQISRHFSQKKLNLDQIEIHNLISEQKDKESRKQSLLQSQQEQRVRKQSMCTLEGVTEERILSGRRERTDSSISKQSNKFQDIGQFMENENSNRLRIQSIVQKYDQTYNEQQQGHQTQVKKIQWSQQEKGKQKVVIDRYEKIHQDLMNKVIKYQISYDDGEGQIWKTWRRYSEFQFLMKYINRTYEGMILPTIPPKEALKSTLTLLYGIDVIFLDDRKDKLEYMLNQLLSTKFIRQDAYLRKFLTYKQFDCTIEGPLQPNYISRLAYYVLNHQDLKDYGIAYYNYIMRDETLKETEVSQKYKQIANLLQNLRELIEFHHQISANFDRRVVVMAALGKKCKIPRKHFIDKFVQQTEREIENLKQQYNNYLKLKSQENWYAHIMQQKNGQPPTNMVIDTGAALQKLRVRLGKIQKNLMMAITRFKSEKQQAMLNLENMLFQWRKQINP